MTYGRFTVTDHKYLNTGGNSMVSIFAVYDSMANTTRWVIANEEGFSLQTADTVTSDSLSLDTNEMIDKIVIGSWRWDELVIDPSPEQYEFGDEAWYLYKYCQFEFYKEDCKYFDAKVRLSVNELPADLYFTLTEDYINWANAEGVGCLTDGYDVFMDDDYDPPVIDVDKELIDTEIERKLQELKDFRQWLVDLIGPETTEEKWDELYDSYITIAVAGNSIKLEFSAENYNSVLNAIDNAIKDF